MTNELSDRNPSLDQLLCFLREIDLLKKVERQTLIVSGGRRENSAEHSWHLSMAVIVFREFAPMGFDEAKAVKMALLHDIVEIDAGDVFVYADHTGKIEKEMAALERITGLLPKGLRDDLTALWHEFEAGSSPEAKFVQALDRFLPMYANHLNEGYSWKKHRVTTAQIEARVRRPIETAIPELWRAAERMVEEAVARGYVVRSER